MQGLGNIPDPTTWIQKGQEVASQFARGRRQAPDGETPKPKTVQNINIIINNN